MTYASLCDFVAEIVSDGLCCCCTEPRPMLRLGGDNEEWMHVDDATFAEHRHVHVDSSSRDCDGRTDHGHVYRIPSIRPEALSLSGEPAFADLWRYLSMHEPRGAYSEFEETTITVRSDRVEWTSTTEEGFAGGSLWVCEDTSCAHGASTYRDHSAEAMGY